MIHLTRAQVREIDRRAIQEYHIPGIVLMENAARAVVDVAWDMLERGRGSRVLIFCGGGNNGGDGLAVARHLRNRGARVGIVQCFDPARLPPDALTNWNIVRAMRIETTAWNELDMTRGSPDLLIDALLGTGATSAPRDSLGATIEMINSQPQPRVLAVDLPSGLDCDSGEPLGGCVRAARTVTFVAEKAGFANPASKQYTGEVIVGDIGCPLELIEQIASQANTPLCQ